MQSTAATWPGNAARTVAEAALIRALKAPKETSVYETCVNRAGVATDVQAALRIQSGFACARAEPGAAIAIAEACSAQP